VWIRSAERAVAGTAGTVELVGAGGVALQLCKDVAAGPVRGDGETVGAAFGAVLAQALGARVEPAIETGVLAAAAESVATGVHSTVALVAAGTAIQHMYPRCRC
jgi:hypothetical protein